MAFPGSSITFFYFSIHLCPTHHWQPSLYLFRTIFSVKTYSSHRGPNHFSVLFQLLIPLKRYEKKNIHSGVYEYRLEKPFFGHDNIDTNNRYRRVDFFGNIRNHSDPRFPCGKNLIYGRDNKRWFFSCFVLDRDTSRGIILYLDFNSRVLFPHRVVQKKEGVGFVCTQYFFILSRPSVLRWGSYTGWFHRDLRTLTRNSHRGWFLIFLVLISSSRSVLQTCFQSPQFRYHNSLFLKNISSRGKQWQGGW